MVCGGYDGAEHASCLVLDPVNQCWDEDRMGDMTVSERYLSAVATTLNHVGVFFVRGSGTSTSSDLLAAGRR